MASEADVADLLRRGLARRGIHTVPEHFAQEMQQKFHLEPSCGTLHHWRSYAGDPLSKTAFVGSKCFCGKKVIVMHECSCGDKHLRIEPVE